MKFSIFLVLALFAVGLVNCYSPSDYLNEARKLYPNSDIVQEVDCSYSFFVRDSVGNVYYLLYDEIHIVPSVTQLVFKAKKGN
jgi:hypothetical protein